MLEEFVGGTLAFDRNHAAARPEQRQAPAGQLVQRRHRPRYHCIASAGVLPDRCVLRAAAYHLDIEPEIGDGHAEELGAA